MVIIQHSGVGAGDTVASPSKFF